MAAIEEAMQHSLGIQGPENSADKPTLDSALMWKTPPLSKHALRQRVITGHPGMGPFSLLLPLVVFNAPSHLPGD